MSKTVCKIEGCNEPVHARGYCRKHYAKMWRARGKKESEAGGNGGRNKRQRALFERIRALKYELDNARRLYDSVVGVSARILWKKRIRWLEDALKNLESKMGEG